MDIARQLSSSSEGARLDRWFESYGRRENFLFYPHEEVVKFVSRWIQKRVGLHDWTDVRPEAAGRRVLDVGCGIGQHLVYFWQEQFDVYGVDLAPNAVKLARDWLESIGVKDANRRVLQGSAQSMPFPSEHFDVAISRGVLDSMSLELAEEAVAEMFRLLRPGGYLYCDLIAASADGESTEVGEVFVDTTHEFGTVQSYFDVDAARNLLSEFTELDLYQVEYISHERMSRHGRFYIVAQKPSDCTNSVPA